MTASYRYFPSLRFEQLIRNFNPFARWARTPQFPPSESGSSVVFGAESWLGIVSCFSLPLFFLGCLVRQVNITFLQRKLWPDVDYLTPLAGQPLLSKDLKYAETRP